METRAWIAITLVWLAGCARSPVASDTVATVPPQPETLQIPSQTVRKRGGPRRLKLTLMLDSPQDLKVKEGDQVRQGQVISDRRSAREGLIKERQSLLLQLEQLKAKTVRVPASDAVEQAEVEQAKLLVEQAQGAIARFQTNSPWTDYARGVLPLSEDEELAGLEDQYQQERVKLAIAIAQLQAAKAEEKVLLQDMLLQKTELLRQIAAIDEKLDSLGVVRSPYGGAVKSLKWLGQQDHVLRIELTFVLKPDTVEDFQ